MEDNKIEIVKEQVGKALDVVRKLSIASKDEFEQAVEVGGKLKKVLKMVTERKEEITKPMNEALKSARALFKPLEESLDVAESELKAKMLVWKNEERRLEQEAIAKAEEARKKEEEATKGNKQEAHQEYLNANYEAETAKVEKTVKTESGAKATEKFITEYVVVDKTKIPMQFLEPDMVRIKASFKAGTPVEGVEERQKAIISF